MCGIFASTFPISESEIKNRLNVINHRGPDNSSYIIGDNVALGHNRLSIVDLDQRANQPFEYNGLSIVFNGEIYNHVEMRIVLEAKGYAFRTTSDTEVLLASYIEYGKDCLSHLNGMFAFVIYDPERGELFGAVDRFGKKPLYYIESPEGFEAASQISQLSIGKNYEVSNEAAQAYFKYKYVPSPLTIFKNVSKLPAGRYFIYDLNQKILSSKKYYTLYDNISSRSNDYKAALSELDDILGSASGLRLMADVPVGVFLSGGIDSSLVAAIGQSRNSEQLNTFCVKFSDRKFDESNDAAAVASYIGSNHTTIECSPDDVIDAMYYYGKCYDEPFADSSALPSMLLSKVARKHVKVALTGDGADETFLGYNRYAVLEKLRHLYKIPLGIRKISRFVPEKYLSSKMKSGVRTLCLSDSSECYHTYMQGFEQNYFGGDPRSFLTQHKDYLYSTSSVLTNAGLYDTMTYLPDDINVKVDRASMFASLELRAPFLDYRVVEYGISLPEKFKLHQGRKKIILRDLASKYLPSHIVDKPKSGFSLPIGNWFRYELKEFVLDHLTNENLSKIPHVDPILATSLIKNHMEGKSNKQSEIFKLLAYVLWMKNWT